jgi:hypothetical protein
MPPAQQLQAYVLAAQSVLSTRPIDVPNIAQTVQAIEQHFRTQILAVTTDDNPRQAIHVEINKQLRLLKTDVLFLRSAKQASTQDQRVQQMRDRLTLLERYCEMILGNADYSGKPLH